MNGLQRMPVVGCHHFNSVNIATFALGRDAQGGSAIALVQVDGDVPETVLGQIQTIPGVKQAKALRF